MSHLRSHRLIFLKGWLFLLIAMISFSILALEVANLKSILLMAVCVWSACRFYYFAFYVIQHYVDDSYHFAGLCDFAKYWFKSRPRKKKD